MTIEDQLSGLPPENSRRFIAVLNGKIETGRLMNALGHMAVGLAGGTSDQRSLCLLQYKDKDGGAHPNISHYPVIVLKAENSNQIRRVREEALRREIPFTDFTSSMLEGTSVGQLKLTEASTEAELEYFGICLFGDTAALREFTKKFSLFR